MKKIDFPLIADTLFYSLSTFVLSLGILRYYRLSFTLALCLALLFALAIATAVFLLLSHRHRKKALSKKEQQEKEALLLHFALEKEERIRAALLAALTADGKDAHCEKDTLCDGDGMYVPKFTMQPLSADSMAHIIKEFGEKPVTVVCNELTPEAQKLASSFGVKIMRGDEVYKLFTRTDTTPSPLICGSIPRKTAKQRLKITFSKRNARPFFTSGVLLLLMSLFTFFPRYYLISGAILLCCAVTVRFFGYSH